MALAKIKIAKNFALKFKKFKGFNIPHVKLTTRLPALRTGSRGGLKAGITKLKTGRVQFKVHGANIK